MPARFDVTIDCIDCGAQADFWAAALGYEMVEAWEQYRTLRPPGDTEAPRIVLQHVAEAKPPGKNRLHLDLLVGDDNVESEVARLAALGATRVTEVPIEEAGTRWVVMRDPEGNEYCVCAD